ncbi:TetR/AcrR family transcriptional regulator [Dermabacteraceae bacterium P13077]
MRRRKVTRELLLAAARRRIAAHGIAGVTAQEICTEAGYTRGAFYSNFRDMEELVEAVVAAELRESSEQIKVIASQKPAEVAVGAGTRECIERILADVMVLIPRRRAAFLARQELELHLMRDPARAQPWLEAWTDFRGVVGQAVVEGLKNIGRELTLAPDDVADLILGLTDQHLRAAMLEGRDERSLAALRSVLTDLFLAVSREE